MKCIGRYELEREIGRGAMGVVHLARDPRLDRRVALKTCTLPEGVSEERASEFHARFLREARAAAGLSHPGIVTVFDSGEDETTGVPYIAMEFVAGHSLKEVLAGAGRCDRAWVMSTGALLADALHQAHQAGIVHRDIKPANILIRESDRAAKLADFGVARLKTSELTRTGAFLGSPGYMSPEQVRGADVDGRSDLFSLAVVLYEAFSGKRPFKGDDLVALAFSITNDTQPPLSRSIEHCPPGFDAFFERALAKDPEKRFPDGVAFREAFLRAGEATAAAMSAAAVPAVALPAVAMSAAATPSATIPWAVKSSARNPSTAAASSRPAAGVTTIAMPAEKRDAVASTGSPRRRPLWFGVAGLAVAGIALAAFMVLHRPGPLTAETKPLESPKESTPTGVSLEQARMEVNPIPEPPPKSPPAATPQAGPPPAAQGRSAPPPAKPRISAPPVAAPRVSRATVPAGTAVHLALDTALTSETGRAGDPVSARVTQPIIAGDRVVIPAGSVVRGQVGDATPAKKGLGDKAGSITIAFTEVVTPTGARLPIAAAYTAVGDSSAGKTAGAIGGGAAGGAILGKVLGRRSKSTALGAVIGAAAGTGIAAGTKGRDARIDAGTPLTISLEQALAVALGP